MSTRPLPAALLALVLGSSTLLACSGDSKGGDGGKTPSPCTPASPCVCPATYAGDWSAETDGAGHLDPATDTILNDAPGMLDGATWRSCLENTTAAMEPACVSVRGRQHHVMGTTADGSTILVFRDGPAATCGVAQVWIYDGDLATRRYVGQDISGKLDDAGIALVEGQLALDPDGLGVVGRTTSGKFVESRRTAVGKIDFGAASQTPFAAVNALDAGLSAPAFSEDGSLFFFQASGGSNPNWQATRSGAAWVNPVQLAGADIAAYVVTGATQDGRSVFATASFQTYVFTRTAVDQPLGAPSAPIPGAWYARPVGGCAKLIATMSPGGCHNEQVAVLTAN